MTGLVITTLAVALIIWAVIRITAWLEKGQAQIDHALRVCLDQEADDWGEPSREQVETDYGPRVLWGPTDAEADAEWADILRVVDLTPAEVQARYQASRLAARMDRIRTDIAVRRFAEELRDMDGGVA